ncbi:hypothetical protein [Acidobacterium sp.]|uniref:Uncharacterized protein n=2 Tax=Acidobacterium capsulatum TaxID=33075 RepID=C1F8W2_ACIC5|nr:hypothetical protein [Acidobacterium sp.]ACO34493.1 hypothetical protein ACP_2021 [Acidobacterium capsulatum ATCC 51196]HCT59886.1 hypothetical protein [Acidobacterium sp.]
MGTTPGKQVTVAFTGSSKSCCNKDSALFRYVGWTSVAVGVAALGVYVGRELRLRYKFNRRTPSDFYAHAGDEMPTEYGMGI